jgi:hypothetical protein
MQIQTDNIPRRSQLSRFDFDRTPQIHRAAPGIIVLVAVLVVFKFNARLNRGCIKPDLRLFPNFIPPNIKLNLTRALLNARFIVGSVRFYAFSQFC